MQMDHPETLIGVAELAIALAGFSGIVVAFRSASHGSWHAGDHLRLAFLLESSLTAAGFALLTLLLLTTFPEQPALAWRLGSVFWALAMPWSLISSHRRIQMSLEEHGDIDQFANRLIFSVFCLLIGLQLINVVHWQTFAPLLAALCANLMSAAIQFYRLINSAFRE